MTPRVVKQLQKADLGPYITDVTIHKQPSGQPCARFTISLAGLINLAIDPRFGRDPFDGALHEDIGRERVGFRSWRNVLGPGSLQIVVSQETLEGYADVDKFNTQDVASILGHTFGELIPHWFKRKSDDTRHT